MKRIIVLFGLAALAVSMFAQNAIKVGAKVSASSLSTNNGLDVFNQNKWAVMPSIGIDYLSHKYYYLNSEICLANIGGKDNVLTSDEGNPNQTIDVSWKYIELNTKFRLQYPLEKMSLYAGAGLYARSRVSSASSTISENDSYQGESFLYGEIFEGGITTTQGKFKADFNVYYYLRNNHIVDTGNMKLYPNTWGLGLSIGYIL